VVRYVQDSSKENRCKKYQYFDVDCLYVLGKLAISQAEVAALFPSVDTPDRIDQEAVTTLTSLMAQLDALITEREELANKLKAVRDEVCSQCPRHNSMT
jgi:hypothetical protein